jgi:hypothetical protein
MGRIFISYSSHDKNVALRLAYDLRSRNHQIWLDEWQIHVGECIPTKIAEGIESATFLILLLSKHAVNSAWVDREWKMAFWDEVNANTIAILPVRLEPCKIPKLLQTKKYADLSESYEAGLQQLVMAIDYFESLKSDSDFYRAIPTVWAEDRELADQARIARNIHWDSFERAVDALPRKHKRAVQIANSLSYLDKYGLTVPELKRQMMRLSAYVGEVDDQFDSELIESIWQFQVAHNLRHHDGVFGPLTYLKMAEVAQSQDR